MDYPEFVSRLKKQGSYKSELAHRVRFSNIPWAQESKFYFHTFQIVFRSYYHAKKDQGYNLSRLKCDAYPMVRLVEKMGGKLVFLGLENIRKAEGSIVFIGNHMSALETFLLPALILPFKDMTFVLKKTLMTYPFFGRVLTVFDPITVEREDPKEDLRTVMSKGTERLRKGRSIIVFPQQTRTSTIDSKRFNTLGVKLAKRSGSLIIPIALKTDLWGNGKIIKDLGRIDPRKKVFIEFGSPIAVESNGKEEHQSIINFIQSRLAVWSHN